MTRSDCPSREELELFAVGDLGTQVAVSISDHVTTCPTCHDQLLELEQAAHGAVRAWLKSRHEPAGRSWSLSACFEWLVRLSQALRFRSGPPHFIAGYRLDGCLGMGGSGVVFQAWDQQHNRSVAIKVMRTSQGQRLAKRFEREVKIASRVDHPNIVKLLSTTLTRFHKPALVMEYVPSVDLKAAIEQQGPFTIAQTATIGYSISRAVQYLHSMQILHRDVKPRNTLLTDCGQIKIVDFGIAAIESDDNLASHESTITLEGQLMGSIGFTSPQILQTGFSTQTDFYSICATMYYLLTGLPPHSPCQRLKEYLALASTNQVQPIAELRHETSHPLFQLIESVIDRRTSEYSLQDVIQFLEQHMDADCLAPLIEKIDFAPPDIWQPNDVVKFLSEEESTNWHQPEAPSTKLSRTGLVMIGLIVAIPVALLSYRAFQREQLPRETRAGGLRPVEETGASALRLSEEETGASALRLSEEGTGASALRLSEEGTGASALRFSDSSLPQETLDEIVSITRQAPSTDESLVSTQLALYNVSIRLLKAELQRTQSIKVMEVLLDVYHNRGILEAGVGTQAQALEYFRRELEMANALFAHSPNNLAYAAKQTTALGASAVMQLSMQNLPAAERDLRNCLELEKRVLAVDRRFAPVDKNHCTTHLNLSHLYLETNRPELALQVLQDAWSYLDENWESDDAAVAQERNLLRLNRHLAHARMGNFVQAIPELEACVQEWESLLKTASDPNSVRMRLTETLREGADTYLAAGDAEASAHALRRANSMAAQVTSQTPNNKFHRAVAGESSLNMAMLATQHPTQMSDVDVPTLVAESQKVFRELYEAEPIDSWINQLKRASVCEAAAVRGTDLEKATERLESLKQLPDAKFSLQLWRDFAREHSLCSKAARELSRKELELRLDAVWQQNQHLFEQFEKPPGAGSPAN